MAGITGKAITSYLFNSKSKKKKGGKGCLAFLLAFGFIIIVVILVIALISIPFVGPFFLKNMKVDLENSDITAITTKDNLDKEDIWDNEGFVKELVKSLNYKEKWIDVISAMQTKRTLYSTDKVTMEEAYNSVKSNSLESFFKKTPAGSDKLGNVENLMEQFEYNKDILNVNLAGYIGNKTKETSNFIAISEGTTFQNLIFDKRAKILKFDFSGKAYLYEKVLSYRIVENVTTITASSIKLEKGIYILTEELTNDYEITANFPVIRGAKIYDILSMTGITLAEMSDPEKSSQKYYSYPGYKPISDPTVQVQDRDMGSYVETAKNAQLIAPETVCVKGIFTTTGGCISVVLEDINELRRYRYDYLKSTVDDLIKGAILSQGAPIGYGSDFENGGLLNKKNNSVFKFRTYLNFNIIMPQNPTGTENAVSETIKTYDKNTNDPGIGDGFYEVESYKGLKVLMENRLENAGSNGEFDGIYCKN